MYLPGELATKLTPFASLADRAVKEKVRILDQIRTLGLDPDFELASSRGEVNLGTGNEYVIHLHLLFICLFVCLLYNKPN